MLTRRTDPTAHVVIRVRGRVYELDGGVFTTWQVRSVTADVVARTGEAYDRAMTDVIRHYGDATIDDRWRASREIDRLLGEREALRGEGAA